ncbi:MAG: sugar O-acetyltransferase [Propioniciclava sp.]|uniref:sugar O-acetyltransferase n=1 Tax=Propioniciclava sp. TaxID=2038686 RepID=UPI0039E664AF
MTDVCIARTLRPGREYGRAGAAVPVDREGLECRAREAALKADLYFRAETLGYDARHLLEELVGHLGEGAIVRPPFFVDYGENIFIGARTFVNYNLTALDVASITIGNDCQIGPNVQLLTPARPTDPEGHRETTAAARPITIGDNVWLGGGVIVCPGVTIGENSVIVEGSVVTDDIPANVIAQGNPACVVRLAGAAGNPATRPGE